MKLNIFRKLRSDAVGHRRKKKDPGLRGGEKNGAGMEQHVGLPRVYACGPLKDTKWMLTFLAAIFSMKMAALLWLNKATGWFLNVV